MLETLPEYLGRHPETVVALAYFDFDLYKPTRHCLDLIKPHLTLGSVIAFDQFAYARWPGETVAMAESLGLGSCRLYRPQYAVKQCYLVYRPVPPQPPQPPQPAPAPR